MLGTDTYHIVIELKNNNSGIENSTDGSNDYRTSQIKVTDLVDPSKINKMVQDSEPLKASYIGEGIIRLYREFELVEESPELNSHSQLISGDDSMVCIVAVPTYFTATDLLGFIGKSNIESITHIRIMKSEKPNRFLVLIKFADVLKAAEFQHSFNGKAFNSMEPETCHALFVRTISVDNGNYSEEEEDEDDDDDDDLYGLKEDKSSALIPFLLNDPFTSTAREKQKIQDDIESEKIVELPTCPVCLERMDSSVTGLLTIPCQHTFHCQCLSKWKDDSCPICRYSINVSNQKIRRSVRRLSEFRRSSSISSQPAFTVVPSGSNAPATGSGSGVPSSGDEHCSQCSVTENLWICLVCGNLGCDRYAPEQHSLKHFIATGHCFAMELETSRVWDYVGDNYVHRLIANESDGKLVELPEKTNTNYSSSSGTNNNSLGGIFEGFGSSTNGPSNILNPKISHYNDNKENHSGDGNFDKVDEVGFEYSQLLISQLASQREYYEDLLKNGAPTYSKIPLLETKFEELSDKFNTLTTTVIPKLEAKVKLKDEKIAKLSREVIDSKSLNEGLSAKVDFLTESSQTLKTENEDLTEQVKDLMFFLETQEKFKDKPDEEKEGQVIMHKPSSSSKSRRKKK
ncbi:RING finger protein Etp1p [[Candida] railenensis]|uniref:RING finger protein Etp1p n=1 Tax=[Candida] railenensis TaxID=45579 RepID=A0A9P0QNS6_9ASCO|nr:RING finger protein Etp1p [[Candida] railenensis]